jgi:hypothetical protein
MLIIVLSIVSCSEKEKPEIIFPKIPFWKLVQGTYKVTNEVNNEEFEMKISIKTDTIWLSNNQYINNDSIFLYNFNNLFDSVHSRYFICIAPNDLNCIGFTAPHGIKDKFGKRWLIEDSDDPNTPEIENTWVNGEITFYFWMNNTAYWYDDGVPYQDLYIRQKGVKIY